MDIYDQAQQGMTQLEGMVSGLPVISDYRSKEMRRDADKKLRESIAATLETERRKLTGLQRDLVTAGQLETCPRWNGRWDGCNCSSTASAPQHMATHPFRRPGNSRGRT